MTRTTLLFVHGGGKGAWEADKKLVSYLKNAIGGIYTIEFPKMPDENDPDYEKYKSKIEATINKVKGKLVLAGHSVGACCLLKYVSENNIDNPVCGLFLIATPFWGKGGWNYEGFTLDNELAAKKTKSIPIFFYHSTNDEIVPFSHLSRYAKKFPHAKIRAIEGRGHQMKNDLSEVVRDIEAIQ